jgi:hypothetical protein
MNTPLSAFPKNRPLLPAAYQPIYEKEYIINRTAGSFSNRLASNLEAWMHLKVAKEKIKDGEVLLEIGAGTLNHLNWERGAYIYDVIEPNRFLIDTEIKSSMLGVIYSSIKEVPVDARYDRILSVAVLEHLCDLPDQIAYSGKLLQEGGCFCAGIPSEGGWLWEMAWRFGTGPGFKKRTGLDYEILMRHEHVNTALEIIDVVSYFFESVSIARFPFPWLSLSLYCFIKAQKPRLDRCEKYLQRGSIEALRG